MSVAETHTTESIARNPQQQLAVGSALGAVAILACLWIVFAGLPEFWTRAWAEIFKDSTDLRKNVFLSDALLILSDLLLIAVVCFGTFRMFQQQTQPGLRAGVFFGVLYLFLVLLLCGWLGGLMQDQFQENPPLGWAVLGAVFAAFVGGAGYVYVAIPGWMNFLEAVEHQGWFEGRSYKGNQGVRVRRGTILGFVAVGACGIITLVWHRFFVLGRTGEPNDWFWLVPYVQLPGQIAYVPLMFSVHLVAPIVLAVLLVWVAWRSVNIPGFADFLIATEAEMNKVSWTNRRRLYTDTIVVLVTVFLFTGFLFVVDIIWIKVLSAPGIQVLLLDPREQAAKNEQKAQW
jgi:preprotein translocase SecE subunit